jgi:nitronate monooxygenase
VAIRTALTDLLGTASPVLLAPMALVSGGALSAAVGRAGGLGFLGGGYGDRTWLEEEARRAGGERVGVGSITWSLARQPDLLDLGLDLLAPPAVWLSFGDARPFAGRVKAKGAALVLQVQTVAAAREARDLGADIIVAQGAEAGGHGHARSTLPLVPAVVDAVAPVPVVAAGGIADGRGLAAALMLGAAGVACGTAFYAAEEALTHPAARERLVAASGDATQRSSVPDVARRLDWPAPWTIRTLENGFMARWRGDLDGPRADAGEIERYARAREAGDFDTAAVIAGEAADLVRAVEPAGRIVGRMVGEAEALLRRGPAWLGDR